MSTPLYSIPGATAPTPAPPADQPAVAVQNANARSVRNALDRARLRQASRLFADKDREITPEDLSTIAEPDIRASRVFQLAAAQKPV
jgi:hypothetical protein